MNELEKRIEQIEMRNKKVEGDKAWETSWFRTILIAIFTYIIAATVLFSVSAEKFLFGAIIPTVGYILSIQSLPAIKSWWIRRNL